MVKNWFQAYLGLGVPQVIIIIIIIIIIEFVERRDDRRYRGAGVATLRIRGGNSEFSDGV